MLQIPLSPDACCMDDLLHRTDEPIRERNYATKANICGVGMSEFHASASHSSSTTLHCQEKPTTPHLATKTHPSLHYQRVTVGTEVSTDTCNSITHHRLIQATHGSGSMALVPNTGRCRVGKS